MLKNPNQTAAAQCGALGPKHEGVARMDHHRDWQDARLHAQVIGAQANGANLFS